MRSDSRWFSVHRWLGIGLGLWFMLVGLTGAVLVFEEPVDRWLNPLLLTARGSGPALPPEAILARAQQLDFGHVERIRLPQAQGEVYRLLVRSSQSRRVGNERFEATFDPASGELLGIRHAEKLGLDRPHLVKTVYEFHRNVLLGEPGSNIVGTAGLLLLASAVTGLVVAWPRKAQAWRRLVWINLKASVTRVAFDVHRSTGALFALLLGLATVTGVTLVWTNYVRDLVNLFSRVESFPTVPFRMTRAEPQPLAAIAAEVRTRFPQQAVTEIRMPSGQLTGWQFYLRAPGDEYRLGDTILWVHPVTGEVLVERSDRTRTRGETLMHWLFPLHSGTAFGTPGLWAMFFTGLTPLLLVGTGLWVWLRKRRGEKIGEQRQRERSGALAASR